MMTKAMSPKLAALIKEAAEQLINFGELWAKVKEQGKEEGYSEKELADTLRPMLKLKGLTKDQAYYLFHQEQKLDKVKEYQKRRKFPTNDDKKPLEQSSRTAELNKLANAVDDLNSEVPITEVVDLKRKPLPVEQAVAKGSQDEDWESEYRKDQGGIGSLDVGDEIRVALFDPAAARDVILRELMKYKSQGWKVIGLKPRHIS
jgi:hypothetical protein